MGFFYRVRRGYSSAPYQPYYPRYQPQSDIISDVFEAEAIVDLIDGDDAGFVENEMLADIF